MAALLARVRALGGDLRPESGDLVLRTPAPIPEELVAELRVHKPELLRVLADLELPAAVADWPEGWRQRFQERAAIIEYDGGIPRAEAERRAEALVREAHRRQVRGVEA